MDNQILFAAFLDELQKIAATQGFMARPDTTARGMQSRRMWAGAGAGGGSEAMLGRGGVQAGRTGPQPTRPTGPWRPGQAPTAARTAGRSGVAQNLVRANIEAAQRRAGAGGGSVLGRIARGVATRGRSGGR